MDRSDPNRFPVAFDRIQAVLQRHGLPLMVGGQVYLPETLKLSQQPSTIGANDPQDLRGHNYLLRV